MTKMKRRIRSAVSMLLCIVLVTGMMPESFMGALTVHADPVTSGDWADHAVDELFPDENGVYEISSAEELAWVAENINYYDMNQVGAVFRLTEDIDLSAHYWTPIGFNFQKRFTATFDGDGHTISGMYVGTESSPYQGTDAGFFGYLNGNVRNLKIADSAVYAAESETGTASSMIDAGLLAGRFGNASVKVSNCEFSGSVFSCGTTNTNNNTDTKKNYAATGGAVGQLVDGGTIDSCRIDVELCALNGSSYYCFGGIAGTLAMGSSAKILNCVSNVSLSLPEGMSADKTDCGAIYAKSKYGTVRNTIGRADLGGANGFAGPSSNCNLVNLCWVEKNYKAEGVLQTASYKYYNWDNGTDKTEAEFKSQDMLATLNTNVNKVLGEIEWSLVEDKNDGFPDIAGAGLTEKTVTYKTVTFMSRGSIYKSISVETGQKVTKPADPVSDDGSTFLYWYADEEDVQYDFNSAVKADLTLTAKWQAAPGTYHSVRFESNGGSYVYPQTIADGSKAIEPDAEKKGYVLDGWYKEAGLVTAWNFNTAVTSDMVLYAKWAKAPDISLSGRITDSTTGKGIRNASVTLSEGRNATTDEFGYYRIPNVPQGSYTITASAQAYNDATTEGFEIGVLSACYDVALSPVSAGGGEAPVNIYVTTSCVFSGIMLDGVDVAAVGEGNLGTYTQKSANGGQAQFNNLPAGRYTFYINQSGRPGWQSYTSAGKDLSGDYQLNCALKPNYQSLKINVLGSFDPKSNKTNAPLKGKNVMLTGVDPADEDNELISIPLYTAADGSVTADKLVPITWKISCSDYAYEEAETTVYADGAGKLSESEVTLTLPFVDSSLAVDFSSVYSDPELFKKTEDNDHPLDVLLSGVAGTMTEGIVRSKIPDSSGKVVFTGLFPGIYNLRANGETKRFVSIEAGDGKEIFTDQSLTGDYFSRFGKKHFDVEMSGAGTASVALGMRSSETLTMDPAPASFSGTLFKTDMDENGELKTVPCANTKITIKPSAYYPQSGENAKGHEITTDANGHYSVSLVPGLYGVEVESTYSDYFGGRITYQEGHPNAYQGPLGWPCTDKWMGSYASAIAWMTSDDSYVYGEIGGMSLSSGSVAADLEMVEKKINYSAGSPGNTVSYGTDALQQLVIGCERDEEITPDENNRTTVWNNYDYYKNTYSTVNYHPETKGASIKLKGDKTETVTMTGRSFPYIFHELSPGDYSLEYTLSNEFSQLTPSVSFGGEISFFDFPAPGKLPDSFPEDYAQNGNPWPTSTGYSGLSIEAKSGKRTFGDIHDSIGFKFYNLNLYESPDYPDQPQKPDGYGSVSGTWNGIPASAWEAYQQTYADRDLQWRWDATAETGELSEAVYDDSGIPNVNDYYRLVSEGSQLVHGSVVYKPTPCTYPEKPATTDSEELNRAYDEAVQRFNEALEESKAQIRQDYAAWYQNSYIGAGFPKAGKLYYAPEEAGYWDQSYNLTSNSIFEKYLVGYSTSKIPDKLFYYRYTVSNKNKPLPDGTVTLYFCAPKGRGQVFLEYLQNTILREKYEALYDSDLWFSVTLDNSETIHCDVNFLDPKQCSLNVTILTEEQARNLLNPRTIAVKAVDGNDLSNVLDDVSVSITYAGREFSSSSPAAQQTCTGTVSDVQLAADEYEWEYDTADQVISTYDDTNKTETFFVPLTRIRYSKEYKLTDDAANPVKNAAICLTGKEYGEPVYVFTDQNGKATAREALTYQEYEVHLSSPGYSSKNVTLTAESIRNGNTANESLRRDYQPEFKEGSVTINRKGAFLPGVSFIGSSNSIDFLVDLTLTEAKDKPIYYTVDAEIITAAGDSLKEVAIVDKRSFKNADFSDIPEALATPAMGENDYNPSDALIWINKLQKGEHGNVYYRCFSKGEAFEVSATDSGHKDHYEISGVFPLWELPPDGFEPCLIAITSNYAVQIYDFDYTGEKEDDRLVGIRISGDAASILDSITLMANAKALGGPAIEKLEEISQPTGSLIPMPEFESSIELSDDGFLNYSYSIKMQLLQGRKSVSDAEKAYMSILPSTLGVAASGGFNLKLDGGERKISKSFDVSVSKTNMDAEDYLPSAFKRLPVKVEFDEDNPPTGKFTLATADTKDSNNNNTKEEYSFGANGQVHVNAEISAFSSFGAILPVGPVLASLEKSGALDIGVQVKVAVGADGTYTYTIINGEETEHDLTFTIGAGAGLGFYAKAFGGALGAEANLKLSGDNDKLKDMVTVSASVNKDGFHMNRVDGNVVADAHIELKTWFINGEKDFTFTEIPFSYQFGTETHFSLTPITVVDNIMSRDDFETSVFNGQPESIVSGLLPIGGYAADEDGSGTFVYTDMSAKGGNVRLQLAKHAGGTSWNTPMTVASTAGLIPAFDVISLTDGEYLIVWSEIAKADMMRTCPPSVIKYSVGKISETSWTGSIKTLSTLSSEVASKLLLVSDNSSVYLAALKTAEGALAEHLSISAYRYRSSGWSGAEEIAKDQETYGISACVKGGELLVSYVTSDHKLHVKKLAANITESVFDATGFETALAADDDNAYLISETSGGMMLRSFSGSSWSPGQLIDDCSDPGNPSLAVIGNTLALSFTETGDKALYVMICGTDGTVVKRKTELFTTVSDKLRESTVIRNDDKILIMTVVDGDSDRLNVYAADGSQKEQAVLRVAPTAKTGLISNGTEQALVNAGAAKGGIIYYALTAENNTPADSLYSSKIPAAVEAGTYYVWYKVVGDSGHYDTAPAYIKIVIEERAEAQPEEPVTPDTPEPKESEAVHAVNVVTGAVATNGAGEEVKTAHENEVLRISWTAKQGYEFVNWNLSGAVPAAAADAATTFVMGTEDVIVDFVEKLRVAEEVKEELPGDSDTTTKVEKLSFIKSKLTLQRNQPAEANPAIADMAQGTAPAIVYVTDNKDIVAVDEAGNFWPMGVGETSVTAYCGNKKACCSVTVVSYTTAVSIRDMSGAEVSGSVIEMKGGEQRFLTVSFLPYDSTDPRDVSWKSNDKNVTVKNGLVTAKEVTQPVTASITATVKATDPVSGKASIEVTGSVQVTVTPVIVEKPASADKGHSLSLKKSKLKLITSEGGNTAELGISLTAKKDTDITTVKILSVESSNTDVITVEAPASVTVDGKKLNAAAKITAKNAGTAYVIVKSAESDSDRINVKRCRVSVTSPAKSITLKSGTIEVSENKAVMRKGEKGTIEIKLDPEFSTDLSKIRISAAGGLSIKKGVICARKTTKPGKPAKITARCGKLKQEIEVTISR